jgi:hypothetical protein
MAGEQRALDLGFLRALVCREVGIAEPAFDRDGFDRLAADRTGFCVVALCLA